MIIKRKIAAALALNSLIVTVTAAVVLSYFFSNKDYFIQSGAQSFRFFTIDSNLLNLIGAAVMIPCEIAVLIGKAEKIPRFAVVIKYITTAAVTLTFFTISLFMGPVLGFGLFMDNTGVFTHLILPLFAFYSFAILEDSHEISLKNALWALVPVLIYGSVYITQAVFIGEAGGGWQDFYYFNLGGTWYITAAGMFGASVLINMLLMALHNYRTIRNARFVTQN